MRIPEAFIWVAPALVVMILLCATIGGAAGKGNAKPSTKADVMGSYKATAPDGRIGVVRVSQYKNGQINVDIVASGANTVGDCHFNFNAPLKGNVAEYTGKENLQCKIRIEFSDDGLALSSTDTCGSPNAPRDYLANCEMGVTLVNGHYTKISNNPETIS